MENSSRTSPVLESIRASSLVPSTSTIMEPRESEEITIAGWPNGPVRITPAFPDTA
jgi:hypothetical protein